MAEAPPLGSERYGYPLDRLGSLEPTDEELFWHNLLPNSHTLVIAASRDRDVTGFVDSLATIKLADARVERRC